MPATETEQSAEGLQTTPRFTPSVRNITPMVFLAMMWGFSIPLTKLGLQTVPPITLTMWRYAVAVPLLLIFVISKPVPWRSMVPLAAVGMLGIGLGQVSQTFGIEQTTASVGTIISATIPIFVVVFAALRLRQKITPRQQLGLLAAFAGIAFVAFGHGSDADPAARSTVMGVVWMMLSATSIAFYYVWSVELTRDLGTAVVAAWGSFFGFLALLPFAVWESSGVPVSYTVEGLAVAAYLGVAVSVAGLFLWLHILRTVPAGVAASTQYLQPVFGIAAASLMFGDRLGLFFGFGVLLILGGLALAVTTGRRQA